MKIQLLCLTLALALLPSCSSGTMSVDGARELIAPPPGKTAISVQLPWQIDREEKTSPEELRLKLKAFALLRETGEKDINATDSFGETALSKAIRLNDTEAVRELLELGADPNNCRVACGQEGLTMAAEHKNMPMVKLLVERGAIIDNEGDAHTIPAFYVACSIPGNREMVEYFIAKGADVNGHADMGRTPMFCASNDNRLILLEHGADINALEGGYGSNALDNDVTGINGVPDNETVRDRVLFLLRHGADPNNLKGEKTSLMHAVEEGDPELVELILQYGGKPLLKNSEGKTAFDYINPQSAGAARIRAALEKPVKKR